MLFGFWNARTEYYNVGIVFGVSGPGKVVQFCFQKSHISTWIGNRSQGISGWPLNFFQQIPGLFQGLLNIFPGLSEKWV